MALYDRRLDPADRRRPQAERGTALARALPLILAAAIAAALIGMYYPRTQPTIGDTNNAGPSVRTVTPQPTPSTAPAVPTPMPTTEPRPTQAPITR